MKSTACAFDIATSKLSRQLGLGLADHPLVTAAHAARPIATRAGAAGNVSPRAHGDEAPRPRPLWSSWRPRRATGDRSRPPRDDRSTTARRRGLPGAQGGDPYLAPASGAEAAAPVSHSGIRSKPMSSL